MPFFLGWDLVFFIFFLVKILFAFFLFESVFSFFFSWILLFSWEKACFLSFFLNSYFFLGWKRVFFFFFFIKSHSVSGISSPDSLLRRYLIKNLRRNFSVALKKHEIAIANKCVCFKWLISGAYRAFIKSLVISDVCRFQYKGFWQ